MTPQELKNSILQLAIQGKLVEQRPEEGTAEELYKQIHAEKQALIKAGKIKKEKPLPEISEDEIPFEIPESWKWVRIASIVTLNPKNELPDELDTAFIPMPCVSDGYRNEHTYEIQKWGSIKKGFTHFADKDIGIAKITPCFQNRKSVIFKHLSTKGDIEILHIHAACKPLVNVRAVVLKFINCKHSHSPLSLFR